MISYVTLKKKYFALPLVLLYIFNCGFIVVGHRGEPTKAPEHSFAAYNAAIKDYATYIEQDLVRSRDGVLVVSHDRTTNRTTNKKINIETNDWSAIKKARLKNNEPIHSLEAVFKRYQKNQKVKFMIETRDTNGTLNMEKQLVDLITQYHLKKRVYFQSFSLASLTELHSRLPQVPTLLLINNHISEYNFSLSNYRFITAVSEKNSLVTQADLDEIHKAKKLIIPYSGFDENTNQIKNNIEKYDGIFTNYAGLYHTSRISETPNPPHSLLITITSKHAVNLYSSPYRSGRYPLKVKLKPNSSWRVYTVIKSNNKTFYDLGNSQWLDANFTKIK